jgi:hypothetical protein
MNKYKQHDDMHTFRVYHFMSHLSKDQECIDYKYITIYNDIFYYDHVRLIKMSDKYVSI